MTGSTTLPFGMDRPISVPDAAFISANTSGCERIAAPARLPDARQASAFTVSVRTDPVANRPRSSSSIRL